MKNLKNFREFDDNEGLNEYYGGEFSSIGKIRSTKLSQRLEDIRDRVKRDIDYSTWSSQGKSEYDILDSPGWITKNLIAGLAGAAAEVTDLFAPNKKDKSELRKAAKDGKISQDDVIELWSDKLGPTTTEKDLEGFAKKSEKIALKRYGKEWNYSDPKGKDQKDFADMIRRGEEEIVKRMKK
jgi:hypothetical protein